MKYTLDDLFVLGKRSGNKKRSYLLIDPLQAKHIPVSPAKALDMIDTLGEQLAAAYPDTGCIIGFAETATAISAAAAMHFAPHTIYLQTTRENVGDERNPFLLDFSEEHSHAVKQVLRTDLIAKQLKFSLLNDRPVMLIDDEISTGKTAVNVIGSLNKRLPLLPRYISGYIIGSVINRMDSSTREAYAAEGIDCASLVFADTDGLEERVAGFETVPPAELPDVPAKEYDELAAEEKIPDLRRGGVFVHDLKMWLGRFAEEAFGLVKDMLPAEGRVLVMGTEECMLPAMLLGRLIEERTKAEVYSHSTTRSPIGISGAEGYPIREGYRIASFYGQDRDTYIYCPAQYDLVIAVTDSKDGEQSRRAMEDITRVFGDRAGKYVLIRG